MRHDLAPKIQLISFDPGLAGGYAKTHEPWGPGRLPVWFAEFGYLIQLANRGFLVDKLQDKAGDDQDGEAPSAPPGTGIGSVVGDGIVNVITVFAAEILLGDEIGGAKRLGVIWVGCGKELAHERKRSRVTSARLGAANRIASYDQGPAPLAEVTRVISLFGDFPKTSQADAVRVDQSPKSFAVCSPAQVRKGIDRPRGGLPKAKRFSPRQNTLSKSAQANHVAWHARLARCAPG